MNHKTNKKKNNKTDTRNNRNNQKTISQRIPTKLQIIVKTNLPEYKKFKYDPVLTLPNAPSHNIYFNPLQPLDSNIIRKIPENSRILSFFNSQMFDKLNQYTALFRRPLKTLEEASLGNVDRNIEITLDTLFPTNGVFYIHREKYYIEFFKWQEGNWFLETAEPTKYTKDELYGANYEIPEPFIKKGEMIKKGGARTRKNNYSLYSRKPYSYRRRPNTYSYRRRPNSYGQRPNTYSYRRRPNSYGRTNSYQNRTYKKRNTKYLTSPTYQIRIFLSLKKGEKWSEEELKKIPCKKQWKDITHSYTTVASDMKKNVKNTMSSIIESVSNQIKKAI
jgi:hypothetical protein